MKKFINLSVENDAQKTRVSPPRYMTMKTTVQIFAFILFFTVPLLSTGSELYKPFIKKQYSRNDFEVSQAQFQNGDVSILLIEAKKI